MRAAQPAVVEPAGFARHAPWLVFPVVMGGALGGAGWLMARGVAPALAVMGLSLLGALAILGLERIMPEHPAWNLDRGDVRDDLPHMLVSMVALPELLRVVSLGGLTVASGWLSAHLGAALWPAAWPLAAQLGLALVVGEFGQYWTHRLMHERALLWRLHALHHSAPRLYWLNAGRFHPLDAALGWVVSMPVLLVLGATPEAIALFLLFTSIHGMLQHANVRVRIGPLNWVFSMTELHRWHHSRTVVESNTNYGANLILWDVVFGTRFLPSDREPPADIGLTDMPDFPDGYFAQLASPFTWRRYEVSAAQANDPANAGDP